jgi:hypothetical protein
LIEEAMASVIVVLRHSPIALISSTVDFGKFTMILLQDVTSLRARDVQQ